MTRLRFVVGFLQQSQGDIEGQVTTTIREESARGVFFQDGRAFGDSIDPTCDSLAVDLKVNEVAGSDSVFLCGDLARRDQVVMDPDVAKNLS